MNLHQLTEELDQTIELSTIQLNRLEWQLWINPGSVIDEPNKQNLADYLRVFRNPDNADLIDHLLTTYLNKPNLIWLTHHQSLDELDFQAWNQRIRQIFPQLGLAEQQIFAELILIPWIEQSIDWIKSTERLLMISLLSFVSYPAAKLPIDDLITRLMAD